MKNKKGIASRLNKLIYICLFITFILGLICGHSRDGFNFIIAIMIWMGGCIVSFFISDLSEIVSIIEYLIPGIRKQANKK